MTPVDHIPPPRTETMMVGVCGSEYDDTKSPERLDAASLRAWNAEITAQDALELGAVEPIKSNHNVGTGSVRSNGSRRKLSLYPGKSRGKDALARDETESVISSVSTHRSKKSLASISSWFSTSNGVPEIEKKPRKSGGGAITAANLAILNQMNYDVPLGKDFPRERPVRQSSKQAKTPKSVEANGENFWWPTIF